VGNIRLYIDEDAMHLELVSALRLNNVDTLTAIDAGRIQVPDETQLQFAAAAGRVLYTFNVADFHELHSQWVATNTNHYGRVMARQQRYSVGDQLRRLLHLIRSSSSEQMMNRVEFLSQWG
jgi:hypothetical protein